MNNEKYRNTFEIDYFFQENEQKFTPRNPALFEQFADLPSERIHQVYISHPSDEYSLRLRKTTTHDGVESYTSALKNRGTIDHNTLSRDEIETPISEATFWQYQQMTDTAELYKNRVTIDSGVTIDFIDNYPMPVIEVEATTIESTVLAPYENDLAACPHLTNEAIAHHLCSIESQTIQDLDVELLADELIAHLRCGKKQAVLGLAGMSGSGKSTTARKIATLLQERYPDLPTPIIISTDDYHIGKRQLEAAYGKPWTNWDDSRVYDTARLATDIAKLKDGRVIPDYKFSFQTEESEQVGSITPSPFIIIEGIHAGSPDLDTVRDVFAKLPTSPATAIGRDVMRLVGRSNSSIANPEARLRYDLEIALPTYQQLKQPERLSNFSASVRPLGDTSLRWLVSKPTPYGVN